MVARKKCRTLIMSCIFAFRPICIGQAGSYPISLAYGGLSRHHRRPILKKRLPTPSPVGIRKVSSRNQGRISVIFFPGKPSTSFPRVQGQAAFGGAAHPCALLPAVLPYGHQKKENQGKSGPMDRENTIIIIDTAILTRFFK